jgi:RNA polymerase sigma-70 factor (ECF subfamily)
MWSALRRSSMEPSDDARLDERALGQLYVKLEKPMYNVVYRWLWNASDAEEVTQEAFLRVWKMRERVDMATVEPLLYRTALNLASNRRRFARVWRWLGLESVADAPASEAATDEALGTARTRQRVKRAIETLPEKLRQVVMLTEYAELSYEEVAAMLRIPVGTVGSRRSAALARLAAELGPIEATP